MILLFIFNIKIAIINYKKIYSITVIFFIDNFNYIDFKNFTTDQRYYNNINNKSNRRQGSCINFLIKKLICYRGYFIYKKLDYISYNYINNK